MWKLKIDPAFDKVVKIYVDFLSNLEASPTDGSLTLPEDLKKSVLEKSDLNTIDISSVSTFSDLFSFVQKTGGITENELKIVFDLISSLDVKEPDEICNICSVIVKSLPEEESRNFYRNKLECFKNGIKNEKEEMDFASVVISLVTNYLFTILFSEERDLIDNNNYLKESNVIGTILNVILSGFSQMAHQATLADLKEDIIKGDEESIFKAVQIDKGFLFMDKVKERTLTAQFSGDTKFLKKLGNAVSSVPLKIPKIHGKTFAVLQLFWPHGLYKLTYEELYDFLVHCGLIPPEYPSAFQKFISRHIKPLYNF